MKRSISLSAICMLALCVPVFFVGAQTTDLDSRRKILEAELAKIEAEIKVQEAELAKQKRQTGSITRDINVLTSEIAAKRLEIQKKNRILGDIELDIRERNSTLVTLDQELTREKRSLAHLLRKQRELENYSLVEALLEGSTISEFYLDRDSFGSIKAEMQNSFRKIRSIQEKTHEEKLALENKKTQEINVRAEIEQDKKKVESKQGEQKELLTISKTKEKSYEQVLAERRRQAAGIRQALFSLRGVSGGALNFGQVYELAREAGNDTGVRPAFIMAILKQETNFGANTGTCNRPGKPTWRDAMPGGVKDGSRRNDEAVFLAITTALGLDTDSQPVSCPLASGGWGGAMGISQFIPTTWAAYGGFVNQGNDVWVYDASKDRIRTALKSGVMSNPWVNLHGVTATGLFMRDLGATAKTYTAERNAACRYYSGRTCDTPGVKNAFYGNSVMKYAAEIQAQIDVLESVK
jgi:hypothetical protein